MVFDGIADRLESARKIVFVTGAGISQESGIPTFRGKDGLWRNHNAMSLASIDAFWKDPALVWEWYNDRRANIFAAKPNDGHMAIAEAEKFAETVVLTQNVDGLHRRAGSTKVLELHGDIARIKCTVCDYAEHTTRALGAAPVCKCGNILRPDVVWFGEPLSQDTWGKAMVHAGQCDIMVIAGTSLAVSPANMLPACARDNGALLVEINPEETPMSNEMNLSVRETASRALPELVGMLGKRDG